MFDLFAMLLSSIATFLFPVFASYKALNAGDPALLKPWLMYWVVLACARLLYETRLHPFLRTHERVLDDFIATTHHRLRTSFWIYLRRAFNLAKSQLLGLPTQQEPLPPPPAQRSYTASLLERFNLPSARPASQLRRGGGWSAADISRLLAADGERRDVVGPVGAGDQSSTGVHPRPRARDLHKRPARAPHVSAFGAGSRGNGFPS
ncbi:hypothetical protein VE04_06084 [Pseudogymnoascus sp. 24MN13]|nr:hypothetical protein VE04_06084 [Pseudogymnoascus sp. 24MN13]